MAKIAVFAGHGGRDNGAQSNGRKEKDYALAVMTNVTEILRNRGYEVINNRTDDVDRSIRADAILANESGVDAVVEIHLNSNEGEPQSGTEVYYSIFDDGKGKSLAQNIQSAIVALGFDDRGIKTKMGVSGRDFFGIIRLTNSPAVLVETAFINNENDMAMYDISQMSGAIADGISETFPISSSGVGGDPTIRRIQSFLNNNYGTDLKVDGVFGPLTKSAMVKAWQMELNKQFDRELEVDGIFGMNTKSASISIGKGARGNLTYLLQGILYARGYFVSPDGIFGIRTENAVKSYQNDRVLYPSGVANPNTQYSLFN